MPTYTERERITATGTNHVTEVVETGDFEAVVTWVIGLDTKRPFTRRGDGRARRHQLVVTISYVTAVEDDLAERRVGRDELVGLVGARRAGATRSTTGATGPWRAAARRRARTRRSRPPSPRSRGRSTVPMIVSRLAMMADDRQRRARRRPSCRCTRCGRRRRGRDVGARRSRHRPDRGSRRAPPSVASTIAHASASASSAPSSVGGTIPTSRPSAPAAFELGGRARGADDAGAERLGELERASVPTPEPTACTSTHSPARSRACVTIASCAVMNASGTPPIATRSSAVGDRRALRRRHGDVLGLRAAADDAEHAVADRDPGRVRRRAPRRRPRTRGRGCRPAHPAAPGSRPRAGGGRPG